MNEIVKIVIIEKIKINVPKKSDAIKPKPKSNQPNGNIKNESSDPKADIPLESVSIDSGNDLSIS